MQQKARDSGWWGIARVLVSALLSNTMAASALAKEALGSVRGRAAVRERVQATTTVRLLWKFRGRGQAKARVLPPPKHKNVKDRGAC